VASTRASHENLVHMTHVEQHVMQIVHVKRDLVHVVHIAVCAAQNQAWNAHVLVHTKR
jgi:hypothetical protein